MNFPIVGVIMHIANPIAPNVITAILVPLINESVYLKALRVRLNLLQAILRPLSQFLSMCISP